MDRRGIVIPPSTVTRWRAEIEEAKIKDRARVEIPKQIEEFLAKGGKIKRYGIISHGDHNAKCCVCGEPFRSLQPKIKKQTCISCKRAKK